MFHSKQAAHCAPDFDECVGLDPWQTMRTERTGTCVASSHASCAVLRNPGTAKSTGCCSAMARQALRRHGQPRGTGYGISQSGHDRKLRAWVNAAACSLRVGGAPTCYLHVVSNVASHPLRPAPSKHLELSLLPRIARNETARADQAEPRARLYAAARIMECLPNDAFHDVFRQRLEGVDAGHGTCIEHRRRLPGQADVWDTCRHWPLCCVAARHSSRVTHKM